MSEIGNLLFSDALQLPKVVPILERLKKGEVLSFNGLAEAGKPFITSLLAIASGRSLCILASSVKQQEYLYSEIMSLISAIKQSTAPMVLHFPEMEFALTKKSGWQGGPLPDLETSAEILNTIRALQKSNATKIVVTTLPAVSQDLPTPEILSSKTRFIRVGDRVEIEAFIAELVDFGYENEAQVSARGHFARRGGIFDIFPFQTETPVRLEFNGNEIESIRLFDIDTQGSVASVVETELMGLNISAVNKGGAQLIHYLPKECLFWREPSSADESIELSALTSDGFTGMIGKNHENDIDLEIFGHDFLTAPTLDTVLHEQRHELLLRYWQDWVNEGYKIFVYCNNEGEERRLREFIAKDSITKNTTWIQAPLLRGFLWPTAKWVVLSDAEIFGRYQTLRMMRLQQKMARARARREVLEFSQFNEGDLVVHIHHGIGRFLGIRKVEVTGREQEVLTLEYEGGALLHVPLEQAHLVGRYVGIGKATPKLDQLGGKRWGKAAAEAQRAVLDYAAKLLKIHAERQSFKGFTFSRDNEWQKEFEEAFLFKATPDQETAIIDTKRDMESMRPMDRLICGDVGFGKTEVAIRAAFKAVMNGKQASVLVPTTVLAQQHEHTFRERMADYPVRIDLLSRFRTKSEQRKTLAATREGAVDILIGTHRLLQPDVVFKDLGLVIVDEEQRFGVKHKERFKEIFKLVDILTLSATPIPRTLYLSLMGAKDMSIIETPPPNRLPVETVIAPYDERLIRSAIEREIARGGQVYFLHNRIGSIMRVRDRIMELVPKARVEVGHGQVDEDELEKVMMRFVAGEIDVLVATTIIESGLDIPRANTIIIDRADRFGLADLYQLRGRVGRSQMKAYAYLLLPRHLMIEKDARKRVSAIKQYSHLGAGFKVAMRDLEIRGAGNILGTEQSGHATAIGFELYCQLLKETLARMKGKKNPPRIEVRTRLDFLPMSEDHAVDSVGAYIPRAYIAESHLRIEAYRQLAEAGEVKELEVLKKRWQDRFGKIPKPVRFLLELASIRLVAARVGITSIEVEDGKVMLQKGGSYITIGGRFPRLASFSKNIHSIEVAEYLTEILKLLKSYGSIHEKQIPRKKGIRS